jgi:nucleotide-binding universal stress UspA family protein
MAQTVRDIGGVRTECGMPEAMDEVGGGLHILVPSKTRSGRREAWARVMHWRLGMEIQTQRRYRIVIALDGSEYAELVLEHGLDQASRHDTPDVHVLRVVPTDTEVEPSKIWLATRVLEGLDAFRAGRPAWRTRLHVRVGNTAEEITNLAAEVDADLLVVGRYGLHHPRHSLAERIVATASCPTLVVGLSGHEVDATPMCPSCAAVREESDGESWFCADHRAPDRARLSTLMPWSGMLSHGGPLW